MRQLIFGVKRERNPHLSICRYRGRIIDDGKEIGLINP